MPFEPSPIHATPAASRDRRQRWALVLAVLVVGALLVVGPFAARVAALRDLRATGPGWSFPSRVYSDGVTLEPGRAAPAPYLVRELEARGYRAAHAVNEPGTYAPRPYGLDIALRGFRDEHDPDGGGGPERIRVRLDAGRIATVERLGGWPDAAPVDSVHAPRLEPVLVAMLFDDQRMWRTWVSLDRVPEPVRMAIIASEDRRFFGHVGIDPIGAVRALVTDVRSGRVRQGGSTITQQLARGLFLGHRRTLERKLVEVPIAFGLELLLTKDRILEMYLNSVYWGQARGFSVGGIAEAARWYFDAPVESLGVLEGATLAAMIPAPNVLDPFTHPERVLERRNAVLGILADTGRLPADEAAALARRPLGVREGPLPVERFPSYSSYVTEVLGRVLSRDAATRRGFSIFTTMDLAWQQDAERAVQEGAGVLGARRLEAAFVAMDAGSRGVRVLVGGRHPETSAWNRAWQSRRQTGSAIKPIVYATALAGPYGFTPATTLADTQRTYGRGRWAWRPRNYDGLYHREVTLAKALEKSLNVATADLVDRIGSDAAAGGIEAFGLGRPDAVPSIGLGSHEVSLVELTDAFAVFEDHGMWRPATPLRALASATGAAVPFRRGEERDVVPQAIASLMVGLLENVVRYGVAAPLRSAYGFERPVAGKTGTTDDFRDAWFVGFTPDVVAGTWVGYDRPASIGRPAAQTALPLWARIVGRMLEGFPPAPFGTDADLQWSDIDPWTGCLADSVHARETVPFLPGTGPLATCEDLLGYGEEPETLDVVPGDTAAWHEPVDSLTEPPPADVAPESLSDEGE